PFARLGEGGIDGGADARVGGVDRRGAGIALVGLDGRRRRQRCIGGRVAAQQQAAEPVAVHGAALEAAGDCRGDLAARATGVAAAWRRRNSVGVSAVSALKARLNGPIDWKPASSAIVSTVCPARAGSASARFASSRRCRFRKALKFLQPRPWLMRRRSLYSGTSSRAASEPIVRPSSR